MCPGMKSPPAEPPPGTQLEEWVDVCLSVCLLSPTPPLSSQMEEGVDRAADKRGSSWPVAEPANQTHLRERISNSPFSPTLSLTQTGRGGGEEPGRERESISAPAFSPPFGPGPEPAGESEAGLFQVPENGIWHGVRVPTKVD